MNEANGNYQSQAEHSHLRRDVIILITSLGLALIGFTGFYYTNTTDAEIVSEPSTATADLQGIDDISQLVDTGNHLMDSQRYHEAIQYYTRVLEIDSTLVDVMVDRGSCFFATDQLDEALQDFEKAISIQPDHAIAHFNLGIVHGGLGNDSLMLEYWKKYLELEPEGDLSNRVRNFIDEHSLNTPDTTGK